MRRIIFSNSHFLEPFLLSARIKYSGCEMGKSLPAFLTYKSYGMHTKSLIFTRLCAFIVSVTILFISFSQSKAYTVSNLATECHNGQIFLTWTNPSATNLQYNVYRSVVPFTLSS